MKIIFAGTPDFADAILDALLTQTPYTLKAVFCQPDRPGGRGQHLLAPPTKQRAIAAHIPVYQPASLKTPESIALIQQLAPDILITAAYGLLIPPAILAIPRLGCLNVHASLLPRWRGASPIQQAILHGDATTGITIMQMDAGLDTGDILYTSSCDIAPEETAETLEKKLIPLGQAALLTVLDQINTHPTSLLPVKQNNSQSTHAPKILKTDANIDWTLPAIHLERQIRAFQPWPVCYTTIDNQTMKIWAASVVHHPRDTPPGTIITRDKHQLIIATGENALSITMAQLPGKKTMSISALLSGLRSS